MEEVPVRSRERTFDKIPDIINLCLGALLVRPRKQNEYI
jgi:hypothetical protein